MYGPLDDINNNTMYDVKFTYLHAKRKPVLGFNFILYETAQKQSLSSIIGSEHYASICKEYGLTGALMLAGNRYPLITAALIQANRDIKTGKTIIKQSQRGYMLKVIENSFEYLQPIINFK